MGRRYTDQDRIEALARLEANAGNIKRTARELGIPPPTVRLWRDQALAAGTDMALSPAAPEEIDWAHIYGEAARLGASIIIENLERYRGRELTPRQLRDVAVVAGIAADKHLDYRDGRRGTQVTVDQRQQTVTRVEVVQVPPSHWRDGPVLDGSATPLPAHDADDEDD